MQSEVGSKSEHSPEHRAIQALSVSSSPAAHSSTQIFSPNPQHSFLPPSAPSSGRGVGSIDNQAMTSYLSYLKSSQGSGAAEVVTSPSVQLTTMATSFAHIETLLTHGQHEEAVAVAISTHQWGLAMLISSCIGKSQGGVDLYQHTIQQFSRAYFPASSPLHALALTYSSQMGPETYTLSPDSSPLAGTAIPLRELRGNAELWNRHFCAILSNKSHAWKHCLRRLGDVLVQRPPGETAGAGASQGEEAYYVSHALLCLSGVPVLCVHMSYSWLSRPTLLIYAVGNCPPRLPVVGAAQG